MAKRQVDVHFDNSAIPGMRWATFDHDKLSIIQSLEGVNSVTHLFGKTYSISFDERYIESEVMHDIVVACSGELPSAFRDDAE